MSESISDCQNTEMLNNFKKADLLSVLDNEKTKKYFSRMFKICTVDLHESGFAVYDKNDGGIEVSKLILPEITETNLGDRNAHYQHSTIDLSDLVLDPRYIKVNYDYDDDSVYEDIVISAELQSRIKSIRNSDELSDELKVQLISNIYTKEKNKNCNINKYRSDINFLCHNHPQHPTYAISAVDIVVPSSQDLNSYEAVRRSSVDLVEAIVSADFNNRKILLYKNNLEIEPRIDEYEVRTEFDQRNTKKRLATLAMCGYHYALLSLNKNGSIADDSRQQLEDFMLIK